MKTYPPGTRIGQYEIASRPMMGGMGVVYFALDHGNEGGHVEKALILGFIDCPLEGLTAHDIGEVQQCSGQGRDRDSVVHRDLVCAETARTVDSEAPSPLAPGAARHGYVHKG